MPDLRQALKDFVATSNSGKYADEKTLLSKFPELKGYNVQTLRDFVATSNSGKYANEDDIFSKFPEFKIGDSSLKKKGSLESATQRTQAQNTTGLPSEDGSSGTQLQSVKDKPSILEKAFEGTRAVLAESDKTIYQFADDLIVSARKGLQEQGFFDDDIPDTDAPITDAMKKKAISSIQNGNKKQQFQMDNGPLDPTPLIKGVAEIGLKIINSTLPQDQKNLIISALNLGDATLKNKIKNISTRQKELLSDNIAVNASKNIVGMIPDLVVAELMGSPAASEGKLAKWGTEISEGARPLLQKYVPKAVKFIEEAVKAPFTKIMATKGVVSGIANAKEGEDIIDAGAEGGIEGIKEGAYMHTLGVFSGKAMPTISKAISKTGMNSKFATAIANPLANAGVFTTAKALRTGIEEQRLISGEEAAMEATTGVGFSLLHAGSLYKNHNELNHYYDNTLKTDPLESLGRVINETKDNLELVYNPNLTEVQVKDLEAARDELKTAIIKEPDLNNKKLLGDEALKIQNQLDAHSAIKGIVENKDALIEKINSIEDLSEEVKSQKTKKVAAIADYFDTSEFGLKKKELNAKVDEAQKKLDDASLGFTDLSKASDRVQAKIEMKKRRAELEGLNNELTDLITNKVEVQEQPVEVQEAEKIKSMQKEATPIQMQEQTAKEEINRLFNDENRFKADYAENKVDHFETKDATKNGFEKYNNYLNLIDPLKEYFKGGSVNYNGKMSMYLDAEKTNPISFDKIAELYHKAKSDNSNPELVQAVEKGLNSISNIEENAYRNNEYLAKIKQEVSSRTQPTTQIEVPQQSESKKVEPTPIQMQESRVKSAQSLLDEAKTKAAKKKAMTDLVKEQGRLAEIKAFEKFNTVSPVAEVKSIDAEITTQGLSEAELPGYDRMTEEVKGIVAKEKEKLRREPITDKEKNKRFHDAVMGHVTGSKAYDNATDVQREALVRKIRKEYGLKEKSAPSIARLFGKLKDITKITMDEMKLIHNDIKMQNLGAKQVIETFNEKKKELTDATNELVKQGKITAQQASNVVKRFAKVNLLSKTSVGRFTEYMAKVFNKADYAKKLNDGKVFKKTITKLSRNKEKNVHLTELGKKFAKIDPSMAENIDKYNAIAADVKEAIKGSTKRLEKINWAGTVKIEDVAKYIDETIEAQDLKLREEKIAELQDLMGVDAKDFSAEEIDELLKTDKEMDKDNSAIAKATIEKGFDIYSTMIKKSIETGKDPFTGESVSYKKTDVEIVKAFMDMDINMLTDKQALAAADAIHNFLVNKSTANMEDVLAKYEGRLNAKEFKTKGGKKGIGRVAKELKKYFSKDLGRFITKKGTPMGDVFVKLFKGVDAGSDFGRLSGFSRIVRGKMLAITKVENISKDYINQFFNKKANGEKFNTAYNEAERGIVADLRRSTPGNESNEFKRRVVILNESIKELKKGTPEEKKKGELYEKVNDKVVKGSKDLSDVESKTDKINLNAIEFWQKHHEESFDDLANYMLNIHNTVLEKGINYSSPDRYVKLSEETPAKLLDNEAMYGSGEEHLYKKEASGLMRAEYPADLPKGRYRDYSFDKNNVNSMRDAFIDMNTGKAIRQLEAFRESPEYKEIIPSVYDRNMVNKRMTDYIANTRNKGHFESEDFSNIIKVLDKTATIGAGMVLGSPLQAIKQTVPIISNTIINSGKLGFAGAFDPKFNNFLNESGYATSHRGVESQIEISSLNKKIELAAEGSSAKLAEAISDASKWWLKTFLVKPDVFIARSSWKSYYEQSLERQGISIKGIDYSDHKLNEKAGDYAEEMVSRQQNVSDHDLAGEWFTKNTSDAKILKKIFLNMASFRMNQSARLGADLTTIGHWSTSTTEDKITAARSLAGYGAEMITFRILSSAAIFGIGSLAMKIKGEEESDKDWEKRYNNILKGQLTSSVVDTFSPAPFLDMGVKALLAPASNKLEEITGLPLSIYGVQKEDWLQQLGAYGMAPQRLYEIEQAAEIGFTGTYKDNYGNIKKISEEDQETIKKLLPFYAATGLGILPSDVATGIKDIIKYSKKEKKGMSIGELKKLNPEMYERMYGEESANYRVKQYKKEREARLKERTKRD